MDRAGSHSDPLGLVAAILSSSLLMSIPTIVNVLDSPDACSMFGSEVASLRLGIHISRDNMRDDSAMKRTPPQYDAQTLLSAQPVVVSVIDPQTHTVQLQNATSLNKFGDIAGQPCYEKLFGFHTPCTFCRMPEALRAPSVVSREMGLPGDQHCRIHWSQVSTKDGRTQVIETIVDVTEHKRTEHALRQSQKIEAVGRLAGGIAHDFNNLLMVIIGFSQRLVEQFATHPAREELDMVNQAGLRAAALTKKLLTFSRRQVFEPKEWPVNQTIREMEDILQRMIGEHIQMVVVPHPHAGHALVDPVQFEQVIMNLVVNARDAMPDGGLLNIETDNIDLDEPFAQSHPGSTPGRYVKIMVQDTGCGMSTETMAHIFEPFFTTKGPEKGTGLGLATVYGIVKQSRGYIEVTSEVGRGTRFTVYLPRVGHPTAAAAAPPQEPMPSTVTQETILAVEDDANIRKLVTIILQGQGYHVLAAGDGVEALQELQMLRGPCHLVITDVIMPRMKSAVFVEAVRAMRPDARVLYMSGYAGDTLQANGVREDMPFLQKPFVATTLIEKVRELLQVPSTR
jgi:two-component system, cell cycle sensor histidine kinase and response regulator CckA